MNVQTITEIFHILIEQDRKEGRDRLDPLKSYELTPEVMALQRTGLLDVWGQFHTFYRNPFYASLRCLVEFVPSGDSNHAYDLIDLCAGLVIDSDYERCKTHLTKMGISNETDQSRIFQLSLELQEDGAN